MRILGIDPGYDRMGVAIVEKKDGEEKLLFSTCVETNKDLEYQKRQKIIGDALESMCEKWRPEVCALETVYFSKNKKTALRVSEIRGVISFVVAKRNIPIFEYTPLQIKQTITGYGKATKEQVSHMVHTLIPLPYTPKHDDEIDAIAVCLTHAARVSTHYPQ